jgi:uncharacterized protein
VKIRAIDVTEKEKVLESAEPAASYPTLLQVEQDGDCRFLEPVTARMAVVQEFDHIRVQGEVGTTISLSCSRCLTEYRTPLSSHFTIFYTAGADDVPVDELELAADDLISVTYSGDEIDFTPEIAEQVLLGIPYKPLCREECLGLCPCCGTDLNQAPCSCGGNVTMSAFSALKDFKVHT